MSETVLSWDKPKKVMPKEQWEGISADGAPPGVFCSNMSKEDVLKWKAKLTGHTKGRPQIEIRRNGLVLIVSLTGSQYVYKSYGKTRQSYNYKIEKYESYTPDTTDINVHMASSSPQFMTFEDFENMNKAVLEAKQFLIDLQEKNVEKK